MKTQVSLLIKNESLPSRFLSFLWFINIFKKMSVDVYLDSENNKQTLKARKEPYLIDVEPGQHQMLFSDPREANKQLFKGITGVFIGGAFTAAAGGSFFDGATIGYDDASDTTVKNNVLNFTLRDGDLLKVSAKPKHNGSVKVKILKD